MRRVFAVSRVRARYAQFFSRSNRLLVSHFDSLAEGPLSRPYLARPSFDFGQVRQRRKEESLYIPLCVFFLRSSSVQIEQIAEPGAAILAMPTQFGGEKEIRRRGTCVAQLNSQSRFNCCFLFYFCFRRPPKQLHKHNLGVYVNVRIFCACPCWKRITGPRYGHAC